MTSSPHHIAIIMDGNGRWAKARGLPRTLGHKQGAEALRAILDGCREMGLACLTIYAFSSENWKRPAEEVSDLMKLLRYYLGKEAQKLHENAVRLRVMGERAQLSPEIQREIAEVEALTAANTGLTLNVALSYGARQEIMQAARALVNEVACGKRSAESIDETALAEKLYTYDLPEVDLLIRTGGEHRLSNFLLWQSAYTELYFTPVLWPDFTMDHLREALHDFARRDRRYGTTSGQ